MFKGGSPKDAGRHITTPAEAVAMADRFTKEQDDYLFTYERKHANRIIALQCAVTFCDISTCDAIDVTDVAKRFEKYLEHGE